MAMIKGRVDLGREVVPRRISVGGESPYREGSADRWFDRKTGKEVRVLSLESFREEAKKLKAARTELTEEPTAE